MRTYAVLVSIKEDLDPDDLANRLATHLEEGGSGYSPLEVALVDAVLGEVPSREIQDAHRRCRS